MIEVEIPEGWEIEIEFYGEPAHGESRSISRAKFKPMPVVGYSLDRKWFGYRWEVHTFGSPITISLHGWERRRDRAEEMAQETVRRVMDIVLGVVKATPGSVISLPGGLDI